MRGRSGSTVIYCGANARRRAVWCRPPRNSVVTVPAGTPATPLPGAVGARAPIQPLDARKGNALLTVTPSVTI
jgi:hypothetical protein